jgi:hypothetical protein
VHQGQYWELVVLRLLQVLELVVQVAGRQKLRPEQVLHAWRQASHHCQEC